MREIFCIVGAALTLCGLASAGVLTMSDTCSYASVCQMNVTIGQPCDRFPRCREITVNMPCIEQEPCTEFWGDYSACSATCGGGSKTRFGRCCSALCTKIITNTESCNTSPCPTATPV